MSESFKDHLYVLIMCGGGGTRLWPRSRKKSPKQFLENFFGPETLFTQTVKRAGKLTSSEKIFIITNKDYIDEVLAQGKIISPRNIIAEPVAKNTAMAIGVGAAYIRKVDPQAIIMTFPSDPLVEDEDKFVSEMLTAAEAAGNGDCLVTVGIVPTFPHTGLGYVEAKDAVIGQKSGVLKVSSFKEKPDLKTAESFIKNGGYYWNAGIYTWSVSSIWKAFEKFAPACFELIEEVYRGIGVEGESEVINRVYGKAENISIDYAVSEKADNLLLVPGTFTWSDVGDWQSVYDLKEKDQNRNVVESFGKEGWHIGADTKNSLILAENKLVVTIGVSNLIIVQTKDSVLVCNRNNSQDVKKIVNNLKDLSKEEFL